MEPDVKNGKGGMRDLHTLFWIAKFVYGAEEDLDFVKAGVFTKEEEKQFRACEDFLWAVRCHLHFLTKRGDDKLTFDKQAEMAVRMGYEDGGDNRHVEQFMRPLFPDRQTGGRSHPHLLRGAGRSPAEEGAEDERLLPPHAVRPHRQPAR